MTRHATTILAVVAVAMFAVLVYVVQDADDPSAQGGSDTPELAGSATTLPPSGSGSAVHVQPPVRITTSSLLYFGRPFETTEISGMYAGVDGATTLRLEVRSREGWREFPLPVVTEESGDFSAYVELGRGQHRLRLVDPLTGVTSRVLTLLML